MCKPHKTGGANRWKLKDRVKMIEMDEQISSISGFIKIPNYYGHNKPEYITCVFDALWEGFDDLDDWLEDEIMCSEPTILS